MFGTGWLKLMQLIVTGFDKFGGHAYNPSQLAVESLPEQIHLADKTEEVQVDRLIVKSCCFEAWEELDERLQHHQTTPCVVIMTGLAGLAESIRLERFALNIKDFCIADNQGHQPEDELIDVDGPDALRTVLPLPSFCKQLTSQGYACNVSNHAGTFLCNELYYRCLRAQQKAKKSPSVALFVHLPCPEQYQATLRNSETVLELSDQDWTDTIDTYALAVVEIARFSCNWLGNKLENRLLAP